MQDLFDQRLEYGFHPVFVLAALLDPKLYPYVHTVSMAERIQAEALVMQLFGSSRAFGNAALGQLKNYREGKHDIPDYAFENPALVADAVGFWTDYGKDNPALKHIARVAIRVLGIPPTAAGRLEAGNAFTQFWSNPNTCMEYAQWSALRLSFSSHAMQVVSAIGLYGGVFGVMQGTACSREEWLFLYTAITISGS